MIAREAALCFLPAKHSQPEFQGRAMMVCFLLLACRQEKFSLARERMDALFMCGILLTEEQIGCHQHDLTI
jgi:hypothetical protein